MKTKSPLALIKQPLMLGGLIASLMLAPIALAQPKQKAYSNEIKQDSQSTGPIAGGGGYVTENSMELLKRSRDLLVKQLRNAADIVFTGLPNGWSRDRMIKVISGIRNSSTKPQIKRDGVDLEFNYGIDAKGEYIEAMPAYFATHASAKVNYGNPVELEESYKEVQLKMLHEMAHLMNIGNSKETNQYAKAFGKEVMSKIQQNYVVCSFPEEQLTYDNVQKVFPNNGSLRVNTWAVANLAGASLRGFLQSMSPQEQYLTSAIRAYTQGDNSVTGNLHNTITRIIKMGLAHVATEENGIFTDRMYQNDDEDEETQYMFVVPNPQIRTNPARSSNPYSASLTLLNKQIKAELSVNGACRSLAKPIQFDYAKYAGGGK